MYTSHLLSTRELEVDCVIKRIGTEGRWVSCGSSESFREEIALPFQIDWHVALLGSLIRQGQIIRNESLHGFRIKLYR